MSPTSYQTAPPRVVAARDQSSPARRGSPTRRAPPAYAGVTPAWEAAGALVVVVDSSSPGSDDESDEDDEDDEDAESDT